MSPLLHNHLTPLSDTYTWTRVEYRGAAEDTPYQRYGHTAVAYNGSCYIYGGRNDVNGVCEHLYRFDIGDSY